jgi:hypothetical protein
MPDLSSSQIDARSPFSPHGSYVIVGFENLIKFAKKSRTNWLNVWVRYNKKNFVRVSISVIFISPGLPPKVSSFLNVSKKLVNFSELNLWISVNNKSKKHEGGFTSSASIQLRLLINRLWIYFRILRDWNGAAQAVGGGPVVGGAPGSEGMTEKWGWADERENRC